MLVEALNFSILALITWKKYQYKAIIENSDRKSPNAWTRTLLPYEDDIIVSTPILRQPDLYFSIFGTGSQLRNQLEIQR